jgi:hypothetical protein
MRKALSGPTSAQFRDCIAMLAVAAMILETTKECHTP